MFFHGVFCPSVSPLIYTTAGVPPAAAWIWGSGELRVQLLGIGVPRLQPCGLQHLHSSRWAPLQNVPALGARMKNFWDENLWGTSWVHLSKCSSCPKDWEVTGYVLQQAELCWALDGSCKFTLSRSVPSSP